MSLETLPDIHFERDSNGRVTPRRIEKQLGDGYTVSAADGLNSREQSYRIQWSSILNADAILLLEFFDRHADGTPFLFQLPLENTPRQWRVGDYSPPRPVSATHADIDANLVEEFGL